MIPRRRFRVLDRRRHRVRRPPSTDGFLVRDLAQLAGVSVHTIKRYVQHGLLAPVPFRGTATRYPRDYLVRLLALRYWRAEGNKTLAKLRRRQDAITFAEMEAWVMSHPLPADTAMALRGAAAGANGVVAESGARVAQRGAAAASRSNPVDSPDALLQLPAESWQRWALMPGLELHLKSDAAPITRHLAARLCRSFASFVSPQEEHLRG